MNFSEATGRGLCRLRLARWANPEDYVRIDVFDDGTFGPWAHLFSPVQPVIGVPTPQTMLAFSCDSADYEEYVGPVNAADTAPHPIQRNGWRKPARAPSARAKEE